LPGEPAHEAAEMIDRALVGELGPESVTLSEPQRAAMLRVLSLDAVQSDPHLRRLWSEMRDE
jgi:hypothetical protein